MRYALSELGWCLMFIGTRKGARKLVVGHAGFVVGDVELRSSREGVLHHALYGEIPIVLDQVTGDCRFLKRFRPRSPAGARIAHVELQRWHLGARSVTTREPVFGIPRFFYVDERFVCRVCGGGAVFSSDEQAHWYEVLKLPVYIERSRCDDCRREKRVREGLASVVACLRGHEESPLLWLEEGLARVRCHESFGGGDLARAMFCSRQVERRAFADAPLVAQSRALQAVVHFRSGRFMKARDVLATVDVGALPTEADLVRWLQEVRDAVGCASLGEP